MIARLRPLVAPALLTLLASGMFVGLGIWQLRRLAWKETIISTIEARTKVAPVPLPRPSTWPTLNPTDYEYRRVILTGTFANDEETPVFRGGPEGAGYLVLTPLRLSDGGVVLVNRGWVPSERKNKSSHLAGDPDGAVTIVGLMRGPEPRNAFTPADDPETRTYFTRDPNEIARHLGLRDAAPFTVDADAAPNPGGWPRGGATVLDIPNNHFSYAMTWFGLALGLLGVFIGLAWKSLSRRAGEELGRDITPEARHAGPC